MLKDLVGHVIGVDTARDRHAAVVVESATGGVIDEIELPASELGYARMLAWAEELTGDGERAWAIEGTGSYGAGLAAFLTRRGELIIEINRAKRARGQAKTDLIDAANAARTALGADNLASPRARGEREAMRLALVARDSAVRAHTQAINMLKAFVLTAPIELRGRLGSSTTTTQLVKACAALRDPAGRDIEWRTTVTTMRGTARRIRHLEDEIRDHTRVLDRLTLAVVPELRAEPGVGPVIAAQLFISWSHAGRCRSEAAFAKLAGVAPLEASSGQTTRHRLNRGGDRQLNRALQTVALYRKRTDEKTKTFFARQTEAGKSPREATRVLKRYLARHFFRVLEATLSVRVT